MKLLILHIITFTTIILQYNSHVGNLLFPIVTYWYIIILIILTGGNIKLCKDKDKDIIVFVDESGSIPKGLVNKDDFFIISMLMIESNNVDYVKKIYKKARLQVINKKDRLIKLMAKNKEIKGSELSEKEKFSIYEKLNKKCGDKFELGIIVLKNHKATEKFRSNSSRTFNYLIKCYLSKYFTRHSSFKDVNTMHFVIDERNVATNSRFTMQEYLNTELNLLEQPFSTEDITVEYTDSKNYLLLQLADFISNTYYRKYQKNSTQTSENEALLLKSLCNSRIFIYPCN